MELRHLRYFIAAAEEQGISAAARRLRLSQPPLSRQIRDLEAELGVPLFDRVGRSIRLTKAGRSFLVRARQIVCDAETAAQQLREQFGKAALTIRLGVIAPVLDDLVVPVVREFRQRFANSRVSLFDLPPTAQLQRLKQHQLDAALVGNIGEPDRRELRVVTLWRGPIQIVLPEVHPLAKRAALRLSLLATEDWLSLSDTLFPGRRAFLRSACRLAGFEPRIVAEYDSVALKLAAVAAGEGVALLPAHAARLAHSGVVFVPIVGRAPRVALSWVTLPGVQVPRIQALETLLRQRATRLQSARDS
jgi:DNA-binding transcriptional LysR family regulator